MLGIFSVLDAIGRYPNERAFGVTLNPQPVVVGNDFACSRAGWPRRERGPLDDFLNLVSVWLEECGNRLSFVDDPQVVRGEMYMAGAQRSAHRRGGCHAPFCIVISATIPSRLHRIPPGRPQPGMRK